MQALPVPTNGDEFKAAVLDTALKLVSDEKSEIFAQAMKVLDAFNASASGRTGLIAATFWICFLAQFGRRMASPDWKEEIAGDLIRSCCAFWALANYGRVVTTIYGIGYWGASSYDQYLAGLFNLNKPIGEFLISTAQDLGSVFLTVISPLALITGVIEFISWLLLMGAIFVVAFTYTVGSFAAMVYLVPCLAVYPLPETRKAAHTTIGVMFAVSFLPMVWKFVIGLGFWTFEKLTQHLVSFGLIGALRNLAVAYLLYKSMKLAYGLVTGTFALDAANAASETAGQATSTVGKMIKAAAALLIHAGLSGKLLAGGAKTAGSLPSGEAGGDLVPAFGPPPPEAVPRGHAARGGGFGRSAGQLQGPIIDVEPIPPPDMVGDKGAPAIGNGPKLLGAGGTEPDGGPPPADTPAAPTPQGPSEPTGPSPQGNTPSSPASGNSSGNTPPTLDGKSPTIAGNRSADQPTGDDPTMSSPEPPNGLPVGQPQTGLDGSGQATSTASDTPSDRSANFRPARPVPVLDRNFKAELAGPPASGSSSPATGDSSPASQPTGSASSVAAVPASDEPKTGVSTDGSGSVTPTQPTTDTAPPASSASPTGGQPVGRVSEQSPVAVSQASAPDQTPVSGSSEAGTAATGTSAPTAPQVAASSLSGSPAPVSTPPADVASATAATGTTAPQVAAASSLSGSPSPVSVPPPDVTSATAATGTSAPTAPQVAAASSLSGSPSPVSVPPPDVASPFSIPPVPTAPPPTGASAGGGFEASASSVFIPPPGVPASVPSVSPSPIAMPVSGGSAFAPPPPSLGASPSSNGFGNDIPPSDLPGSGFVPPPPSAGGGFYNDPMPTRLHGDFMQETRMIPPSAWNPLHSRAVGGVIPPPDFFNEND